MRAAMVFGLSVLILVGTLAEAQAWHRWRRHRTYWAYEVSASSSVLPGFHCPNGQYWRPSLGICQGSPYRDQTDQTYAPLQGSRPLTVQRDPTVGLGEAPSAVRRVVDTDTRITDRHRAMGKDGVIVTYVVRTRVTERYPRTSQ